MSLVAVNASWHVTDNEYYRKGLWETSGGHLWCQSKKEKLITVS
jgi:hypothetical protein